MLSTLIYIKTINKNHGNFTETAMIPKIALALPFQKNNPKDVSYFLDFCCSSLLLLVLAVHIYTLVQLLC